MNATRTIRWTILIGAVMLAPVLLAAESMIHTHDDVMNAIVANTPEKHQELAAWYRSKAEAERAAAQEHRTMANGYLGSKIKYYEVMKEHCDHLVALHEKLAKEYEALSTAHEAKATK